MKKYLKNNFDFCGLINVLDELPLWSAPFGLKLLEYVNYKPNIKAIDIGFGTGFPLTELAMRLGNSSVVYGIDPWKEAIARTNKKIELFGITNIKIIEGIAESIPLENNSVDLIVSNNGLNNVNDINKVLAECSRIIKPNGQFVLTMNLNKTMFEFYEQLESVLSDLQMQKEIDLMYQHIYQKRRPLEEITELITQNGFKIKDCVTEQFCYKFTDGTTMLNHFFIRLAFIDSWIKFLPKEKLEQIFDTIEARLNEQAKISGSITLTIPFVIINAFKKL